ncbi:hypothetical protein DNTS_035410 [Danionella cerebrum]|uniref:Uncharacterized protein n=1 Tax=Danionella cerebrum TaxID=2873325 RepID=A0A553NWC7_9TELE|nr:hypothetical protein DNTS_035410 [Danionella translucida]
MISSTDATSLNNSPYCAAMLERWCRTGASVEGWTVALHSPSPTLCSKAPEVSLSWQKMCRGAETEINSLASRTPTYTRTSCPHRTSKWKQEEEVAANAVQ